MAQRKHLIARLLWIFPALLILLTVHQAKVAYDIHQTLQQGTPATAEVVETFKSERVDVSFDYVSLRVPLPDGRVLVKEKMSLPHMLYPQVEGKETLDVLVMPGEAQAVVIADIARPQWRIAAINAAMSFLGFLFFSVAVFAWNRFLNRKGDPADRPVPAA